MACIASSFFKASARISLSFIAPPYILIQKRPDWHRGVDIKRGTTRIGSYCAHNAAYAVAYDLFRRRCSCGEYLKRIPPFSRGRFSVGAFFLCRTQTHLIFLIVPQIFKYRNYFYAEFQKLFYDKIEHIAYRGRVQICGRHFADYYHFAHKHLRGRFYRGRKSGDGDGDRARNIYVQSV